MKEELREWELFPREYELYKYIRKRDYTLSRFGEEIAAGLEKDKDLNVIFPDLLNDEEDLWKIFGTVREVGQRQITMDFVHLNVNTKEAERRGSSDENFLKRWNNSQQIQESLIAAIKRSNLNIDLIEIDANRNAAEVHADLRRELVGRTTFPEKELICTTRPELI